jgi:hypothetical protein
MAKKPEARSKTGAASRTAPKLQKTSLKSLTSRARSDDKVVGGLRKQNYSCGINCSTSKDPT